MDILGRRPSVLIADDHRDLAKTLAVLLKLAGFDAEIVHDGRDALKAARAHRPDVLLLDISLPGLDGVRVAEQMRSDPLLSNVLIIGTSAYDPDMLRGRSRRASFDHRLVKPVAFQSILSLLARMHWPCLGRAAPASTLRTSPVTKPQSPLGVTTAPPIGSRSMTSSRWPAADVFRAGDS